MLRPLLTLGALTLAAAPATAATYSAKPAVPFGEGRIVARDVVWACSPAGCVGATQNSRPLVLCQSLAKKAGRIETFLVDGRPLAAQDLDRCNASAKTQPGQAIAAQ